MRSHALKVGAWTVESAQAQERLSFETLYSWLEEQHSKREWHFIKDHTTKKLLHRYKLAFKRMNIPPDKEVMHKYKKGGKRLSDWIIEGRLGTQTVGIPQGIIDMLPPTIVHPPPGAAQRNARAETAWGRGRAARQRISRTLRSVVGDSEDAQDTRRVVGVVMQESGAYSTESDDELAAELEREMAAEEGGGGGAGPSQGGGDMPLTLEEVQHTLMADSDETDEGAVRVERENDEGGSGAGVGVSSGGDGLSEYERQRRQNIERNEARLREMGLLNDPLIPSRPPPPPRQPRPPPRVQADGPQRASGRIQGLPRPAYADKDSEEEEEEEDETPQQGQEDGPPPPQIPRRSTRVVDNSERESFSEQTRAAIRAALATATLQGTGLELVQFMSTTQQPRDQITSSGVRGDAEELNRLELSVNILLSLQIRDFLSNVLTYRPTVLWKWIAHLEGLDITALLYRGEVIGAAIGFYSEEERVYLTHVTATHRSMRGGVGVGLFLRRQQLQYLQQRLGPGHGPLEIVSLSANRDGDNRGAVQFQRHVFTQRLGFEDLRGALPIIRRIAEANPELGLDRILQQDVTPLRFRHTASSS